ncbi:MAG: SCO family protein [Bacteroidia bacterium]
MGKKYFFIAIGILAIPVAIFFVLNQAKQNYKSLPIFGERYLSDKNDTIYYQVPHFSVTDQTGATVNSQNLSNNIVVASFFFATCTDVCPTMNRRLQSVYDKVKQFEEVKFFSFSVDPKNDTTEALLEYSKKYNANPQNWLFCRTENNEQVVKIGQGFLLPVSIEDETIDHSQQFILIDKQRRIRGIYNSLQDSELKRLTDEIKVLLYEYYKN